MPRIGAFEKFAEEYERWFDAHEWTYESELNAVRSLLPEFTDALEVGVGTGRFAIPLGVKTALEPSPRMAQIARAKGLAVDEGVCEQLPYENENFDLVLVLTTICFVDDPSACLAEINRVLKPGGYVITGFIDGESKLAKEYLAKRGKSKFYSEATFYSAEEIKGFLEYAGFKNIKSVQTIFRHPGEISSLEPIKDGHGEGSFVVMRGRKR